jgi:hypothetical protein
MPDTMTGAVVNPAYPGESYINFDTTMFASGVLPETLVGTWGIDVVVPPIPEIDYLYRVKYDATNLTSDWQVVRLPNMELPAYNATVINPNDSYTDAVRGTTFASVGYGKARAIGCGHTFELDASATNNQGRVVAAQIEGQWTFQDLSAPNVDSTTQSFLLNPTGFADAVTSVAINAPSAVCKLQILNVPTDPKVLVAACPSAYQADAKFGAYAVTKFSSPLLGYPFKQTGNDGQSPTDNTTEASLTAGLPMSAFGINTKGYNSSSPLTDNLEPFTQGAAFATGPSVDTSLGVNAALIHPWVSMPSEMMVNVVMFRNLSLGSSTTISSNAVVHVKSRNYFECIPNAQNPATTPFTHSPAQYDYPALDAVITVGKQLADAYPASANDLGEMIGTIWDGLKEIVSPIAKEVGGLGIPVISGIAQEVHSSLHTNADSLNNKMQQMRHLANNTHVGALVQAGRQALMR